jgi:hypothetical protein
MPECRIIFPDHSLILEDYVFGHFGNKLPSAWQYQVVKLNHLLYKLASESDNLLILGGNPSSVSDILDHPLAVTADLHFSLPYIDWLGRQALGMIESRFGKMKKCVILDLDNTLSARPSPAFKNGSGNSDSEASSSPFALKIMKISHGSRSSGIRR